MRHATFIALVLGATPVLAQTAPKTVKTMRIEAMRQPLFIVEADDTVRVDWRRVEVVARSGNLTDRDIARALMAVRDGTAKPTR